MLKKLFLLVLTIVSFESAQAQQDTLLYYLTNSGDVVDNKADADYFLLITKPAADATNGLFPVYAFYPDGKRKFVAASKTYALDIVLDGTVMQYFSNGKRKSVTTYSNGVAIGNQTQYYPNGKIYALTKYEDNFKHLLNECRDSTGTVLAQNGEGKWLVFDDSFKHLLKEGPVLKGLKTGEWRESVGDSIKRTIIYSKGEIKSGTTYKNGKEFIFKKPLLMPFVKNTDAFAAGLKQYYKALAEYALRNSKPSGPLAINFFVEVDGSLTAPKTTYETTPELNALLVNALAKSVKWEPALDYGVPTRMQATYSPVITSGLIAVPSGGVRRGTTSSYIQTTTTIRSGNQ